MLWNIHDARYFLLLSFVKFFIFFYSFKSYQVEKNSTACYKETRRRTGLCEDFFMVENLLTFTKRCQISAQKAVPYQYSKAFFYL